MGQKLSLPQLQDCIRRDFSDRLLVSHGLFRSAYPRGTHVLCEVDLVKEVSSREWRDKEAEFVIQVISGVNFLYSREKLEQVDESCDRASDKKDGASYLAYQNEPDNFAGESSVGFEFMPAKGLMKCECTFSGGVATQTASCLKLLHNKIVAPNSLAEIPLTSTLNDEQWIHNFEALILKILAKLAPRTSIQAATFNAVVDALHQLNLANKEESILRGLQDHNEEHCVQQFLESVCLLSGARASGITPSVRHPNIVPVLGAFQGDGLLYMVYPPAPHTLESILHFSPSSLGDDWDLRFLAFQLLSALAFCHSQGILHGDLKPSNILLTDTLWCRITGFGGNICDHRTNSLPAQNYKVAPEESIHLENKLSWDLDSCDWKNAFSKWWRGEMSNYDYLLVLNKLAGRRWADCHFHTVMPWVIDFSVQPDERVDAGWRDLQKSKWRLAKGDEQLDFTYTSAEIPHHVSDECLSELAVCIYKARRLPLLILRRTVRSVYEPNEYPATMQRLYQWTPDECIPEFYSDPCVFSSIHSGMNDLAVPLWAQNAENFILWHRAALESDRVSRQLHHWIDLTFGFKLSGAAAVAAKNVTLSTTAGPYVPRSTGRRQLFYRPHPKRRQCQDRAPTATLADKWRVASRTISTCSADMQSMSTQVLIANAPKQEISIVAMDKSISPLEELEEASTFCELGRQLSPSYKTNFHTSEGSLQESYDGDCFDKTFLGSACNLESEEGCSKLGNELDMLLGTLKVPGNSEGFYQDFLLWQTKSTQHKLLIQGGGNDIIALGCILVEIYLKRPLFDPVTIEAFVSDGIKPGFLEQLPIHVRSLAEAMLEKDPARQPTAARLLESPFFPPSVRAVYSFLSSLHLLASQHIRLEYVAQLAREGAFLLMGPLAAEKCIASCLSLLLVPCENIPVGACMNFLRASLVALKPQKAKLLLVPAILKLLQSLETTLLKVALFETSFMRDLRRVIGTSIYIQQIHFSILANLQQLIGEGHAIAASILLIETCQELGVPITSNQTIMPLLQYFGRDITVLGIETLVGIGERLGEEMMVKHILPSLRAIITSGMHLSNIEKNAPAHSWRMLAMVDAMTVLERLIAILPPPTVLLELVQEPNDLYTNILLQSNSSQNILQCAAKALLLICQCIGPESSVTYVLPQLKGFFDELAFEETLKEEDAPQLGEQRHSLSHGSLKELDDDGPCLMSRGKTSESLTDIKITDSITTNQSKLKNKFECQMALMHVLYPGFASLLGITRLRQLFTTWLILEKALHKYYNWKWEDQDGTQKGTLEKRFSVPELELPADFSPTNLLLHEVGWSVPQSQVHKIKASNMDNSSGRYKLAPEGDIGEDENPWFWVPKVEDVWENSDYLSRPGFGYGMGKDEQPWKLKATILHSWRAHFGTMRAVIVGDDENTVFTAGVGARTRGLVRQWKLSTTKCIMDYMGHEEAVNEICFLPGTERIASCDGTIHLWSLRTGKRMAIFSEPTGLTSSSLGTVSVDGIRLPNTAVTNTTGAGASSGILSGGFHGSTYTCMHFLEAEERLVAGTGTGHIRFIDIPTGRLLHSWRSDSLDCSLFGVVSAICSSGQQVNQCRKYPLLSSWIAVGFSSGHCRLLDLRSGSVVAYWRAHDGFITKMASFGDHFLVSSSLDKTLSLWDLRRNLPVQMQVFRGHYDGVSSFDLWSNNMLSAGGNKIAVSSLSVSPQQGLDQQVLHPQKLYLTDRASRSLSNITTVNVLPFSKLFLIGTEDGHLKVCM